MSKTLDLGAVTAYALAVKNGFTGTEAEWLASLKGADGVSPTAENIASALGYTPAKQADVDTLSQNLVIGYDTNNVTAQVAAVSGTYTAPGNGTLVFTLPYNTTGNTIGIDKEGIALAGYVSVVANTQYIPFKVFKNETYGFVVTGSVYMRFVPDKMSVT